MRTNRAIYRRPEDWLQRLQCLPRLCHNEGDGIHDSALTISVSLFNKILFPPLQMVMEFMTILARDCSPNLS